MTFAGNGVRALRRPEQGRHGRTPFARIIGWGISAEEDGAQALLKSSSTNSDIN